MGEATAAHLSIGEVLGLLLTEFPDVTISKIRFLESQGLIEPERTQSVRVIPCCAIEPPAWDQPLVLNERPD